MGFGVRTCKKRAQSWHCSVLPFDGSVPVSVCQRGTLAGEEKGSGVLPVR